MERIWDSLLRSDPACIAAGQAVAMVTFPAVLAGVQAYVLRPLRICAHQRVLGNVPLLAIVAVAVMLLRCRHTARRRQC